MTCRLRWCRQNRSQIFQYGWRLGEFHGMSSQSHLPHCRVLPLGEFTVMFQEPHAPHCRVQSPGEINVITLQGVIIPSAMWKIVFRHIIFFCFIMQFGIWRAVAFVSSPIHLLYTLYNYNVVFWWNWSVFNVLSKTYHSTELRHSFGPVGQNFGFNRTL